MNKKFIKCKNMLKSFENFFKSKIFFSNFFSKILKYSIIINRFELLNLDIIIKTFTKRISFITDSNRYTREFSLQRSASFNHKGTSFINDAYAFCRYDWNPKPILSCLCGPRDVCFNHLGIQI